MASNGVPRRKSATNTPPPPTRPTLPTALRHTTIRSDENPTVTPEQDQQAYLTRTSSLLNAPSKNYLMPTPLVRTKLSKGDIGDDADAEKAKTTVVKTSTKPSIISPLTHTKITEKADSNGGNFAKKKPKPKAELTNGTGTADGAHRSTIVKLKGIDMKRTNNKVVTASSTLETGLRRKGNVVDSARVKPTRTTVAAHYVPSKMGLPQSCSAPKNVVSAKSAVGPSTTKPPATTVDVESKGNGKGPDAENGPSSVTPSLDAAAAVMKQENMKEPSPKTELPEQQSSNEKPPKYFKSKFWSYVDPNRKPEPLPPKQYKDDARRKEIRDFIEKQRQMKLLQQKKNEEERRKQLDKKKKQLDDLEKRSRETRIASASKCLKNPPSCAFVVTDKPAIKQFRNKQSLSPMKARRTSDTKTKSSPDKKQPDGQKTDAAKVEKNGRDNFDLRTSTLLREFEHIVQQECMSILRVHPSKSKLPSPQGTEAPCVTPSKVDVAVETTISLFDKHHYEEALPTVQTSSGRRTTMFKTLTEDRQAKYESTSATRAKDEDTKTKAATKIQAAFKGYRTRKMLKEVNLLPGRQNQNKKVMKRIWPFTKSEKSTEAASAKPTVTRSSTDWNFAYIPPPEQNSFSSPTAKGLPVTSLSHIELSRFHEPFPKEALRRLSAMHNSPKPKSFYERRYSDSAFKFPPSAATANRESLGMDVTDSPRAQPQLLENIESCVPTFSTVLKEKMRLLEEKTTKMISSQQEEKSTPNKQQQSPNATQQGGEGGQNSATDFVMPESDKGASTITDEYIGPDEKKMKEAYAGRGASPRVDPTSPKRSKHTRKKKLALAFSPHSKSGSTTTVDTDVDLQSECQDSQTKENENESRPEVTTPSASKNGVFPSSSFGIEEYPTPALQLKFQAEKERLHILEKALKTTLATEPQHQEQVKYEAQRPEEEMGATRLSHNASAGAANHSHDYMIQLAKCQADCLKATAEVTKWMTELRKAEQEREYVQRDQQTVNMAAVVFAAVEEAKRMSGIPTANERRQDFHYQPAKTTNADEFTQFPSEKSEFIFNSTNADEFTQFPSEKSDLADKEGRDEDEEIERVPVKLDSFSSASDIPTFMTEKSTIDTGKPGSVAEISHGNQPDESYNEDDFEKPTEEEETAESVAASEDLKLSPMSEKSSVAETENERELSELLLRHDESEESLKHEIYDTTEKPKDNLKAFEAEIKRITNRLAPESTLLENTEDSSVKAANESEVLPQLSPEREAFEQETENHIPQLHEQCSTGLVHELASEEKGVEEETEDEVKLDEISASSESSEDQEQTSTKVDAGGEHEADQNKNVPEEEDIWQFVGAQMDRSEVSTTNSVASIPGQPEVTIESPEKELISVEGREIEKDQTAQITELESEESTEIKTTGFVEPIVQEPVSPVNVPDVETEGEVQIEEVKDLSPSRAPDGTSQEIPEKEDDIKGTEANFEQEEESKSMIPATSPASPEIAFTSETNLSPVKPPPPYSSPSSKPVPPVPDVKNTCKEWQVRDMIQQHIDYIWDCWIATKKFPSDYESFTSNFPEDPDARPASEPSADKDTNHAYELMISDAICEAIQEVLDIALNPSLEKPLVDQVRLGPLAMKAQKLRLPQTKEKLFQLVYDEVLCIIPPGVVLYTEGATAQPEKRCMKWACKERDLADEVLAQELVKEDRSWLNCWPEEVIVQDRLTENLIKRLISQVVTSFEIALK